MASEFEISYQGSVTIYTVVRRKTDAYVWNGTAYVVWADGGLSGYANLLTNKGGDLYQGDFPSDVAAGNVVIFYYLRAGGTPAITDLILKAEAKYWTGTSLTTASTVALSDYALATLEQARQDLGISDTSYDTVLTEYINQTTDFIETACSYLFKARDYRHRLDGNCQSRIVLPHWPLLTPPRVLWGKGNAMSATYTGTALIATIGVSNTGVRIYSVSSAGASVVSVLTFAACPALSLMAAAINAISGWTAVVQTNRPSVDLNPTGAEDAKNRLVWATYPDRDDITFDVDYEKGIISIAQGDWEDWIWGEAGKPRRKHGRGAPSGFQNVLAEYRAGHETIPDAVNLFCREIISGLYFAQQVNPSVSSFTLGPFSVRADSASIGGISMAEASGRLSLYTDYSRMVA